MGKNILITEEQMNQIISTPNNNNVLNVLVACEESQAVCIQFRNKGHNAFSCDLQECSGGKPEWHINGDVIPIINGNCTFQTSDGKKHKLVGKWDLIIAHPPCTYLTTSGNRWFDVEKYGDKAIQRAQDREDAVKFFMLFANADCEHIAIENPVGIMSTRWQKSNQIIQPWHFGDAAKKKTCLWLKGLPNLEHTHDVEPEIEYLTWIDKKTGRLKRQDKASVDARSLSTADRQRTRSKTFLGIAKAFANQWANYVLKNGGSNSQLIEL